MTCCFCTPEPTTEDSQPYTGTSLEGFANQTNPTSPQEPGSCCWWGPQNNCSHSQLCCPLPTPPPAALCQDSEGLQARTAPTCLAAGHRRTRPDGYLGLGPLPLPVPPQLPVGKGEECPFQLIAHQETLKEARASSPSRAGSFLTAKLGRSAPRKEVLIPPSPLLWCSRGESKLTAPPCPQEMDWQSRQGRGTEGRRERKKKQAGRRLEKKQQWNSKREG